MSSTFAFVASVLRPPRELLLRVRWSLMLFVPLSLVPWLIALAHTSVAQLGIGLLTLVLFGVSWSLVYRRDELPPLAFELAHFPIAWPFSSPRRTSRAAARLARRASSPSRCCCRATRAHGFGCWCGCLR